MNPKQFLVIGGAVLVLVALLGFFGVVGPGAEQSLFGETWIFTQGENWAHLVLGIVALVAAFVLPHGVQKWLTILVGLLALIVAVWGFTLPAEMPNFFGANLENPADNILHIVIAVWAFLASM